MGLVGVRVEGIDNVIVVETVAKNTDGVDIHSISDIHTPCDEHCLSDES